MRTGTILVFPVFLLFAALNGCGQHGCLPGEPLLPRHENVLNTQIAERFVIMQRPPAEVP